MRERISTAFEAYYEDIIHALPGFTAGLLLLLFFGLLGYGLQVLFKHRIAKRLNDELFAAFVGRLVFLVVLIFGIVAFLNQAGWGRVAGGLMAGAGVTALVLGFAFRDIGENLLSGIFLAFSRPFRIGDIVKILDIEGRVQALKLRNTHMRTFDGRDIFVPNAVIIKNPLTNFTRDGLMRHDFMVHLSYDENVEQVRKCILTELHSMKNIVQRARMKPMVIIDRLEGGNLKIKVFYWVNTFDYLGSVTSLRSSVMEMVFEGLKRSGYKLL